VTTQYISSIKLQMKKEGLLPEAARAQLPSAEALAEWEEPGSEIEEGVVDLQVMLTAARLIRRCGTLQEAHRALDQAERLASALQS
jgi:hypothetical protein